MGEAHSRTLPSEVEALMEVDRTRLASARQLVVGSLSIAEVVAGLAVVDRTVRVEVDHIPKWRSDCQHPFA